MGRVRVQLLLVDNTWSTRYIIRENGRDSNTSINWNILSLNFTEENYGIKLIYNRIDTANL